MAATTTKQIHIDALQTVTPARAATPGQSRRILLSGPLPSSVLRSHAWIVFYYKRESEEEDDALAVAARLKESLNEVLPEEPVLAGRLRKEREAEGWWEVRCNDSGVRLVQATAEMSMEELLGSDDRDEMEAKLAYWVDVKLDDPQFWPLFYVQVTQFQGDGYAIGISFSVLLTDLVLVTRFVKSWAEAHTTQQARDNLDEPSLFHLSQFKCSERKRHLSSMPEEAASSNTKTILFKARRSSGLRPLAITFLEGETSSKFTFVVNDHAGDLKVESCDTDGLCGTAGELSVASWDDLGAGDVAFVAEKKPDRVAYGAVAGVEDEGLVVAMLPAGNEAEVLVSVTVPVKS